MSDGDLIKLYSGRILELAADIPLTDRLADPMASVKKRSPLCGSTVTVDVTASGGKVSAFGQDVKACALGQASASIIGKNIIGRNQAEVSQARDQLLDMLKAQGPAPVAPFDELHVLEPAREFKNRHASIMLTLEAVLGAFDSISEPAGT